MEPDDSSTDRLPPPSSEKEKRTSWVNENFDDNNGLFAEETDNPASLEEVQEKTKPSSSSSSSSSTPQEVRHSATTALSTVVADAYTENRESGFVPAIPVSSDDGGGALLEVDTNSQSESLTNNKPTSHRSLPSFNPSSKPRPGSGGAIRMKHSTLRSLEDTSHYDLQVSVSTREKNVVSKTDSFFIYQIQTKSSRLGFQYKKEEYTVWRRYRDFEWLHTQLEKTYPTLIVPPLPGKQLSRYFDHQSDEFLTERQKGLNKFLCRLVAHPFFSYDDNLSVFLTAATPEEFASHVADTSTGNKLFGIVSSSVKQATTSLKLKNPDPDFVKAVKYFSNFSEKTGVLERVEMRLLTERNGLSSALRDVAVPIFSWSNSEPFLSGCIRKLGSVFDSSSSSLDGLSDANTVAFLMAMKEYHLYAESALSALRRRDALQLEYETACDERSKKKKAHEDAVLAGKTEKVEKISAELSSAGVLAETALDKLTQANEQLRVDVEKWQEAKDIQWSAVMREWAGNHINYHQKMYSQWEKLLTMLREMDEDTAVDSEEKKKKAENKLMAEDGEELTAVNIEP